jgi:DNA-binding NarL/FixJ family response regulator
LNRITVYIADDHPVVRKGMARLLRTFERIDQIREASNGRELIDLLIEHPADVVILDLEMPRMGGLEAARIIVDRFPKVKILILTMHTEQVFLERLLNLGVHAVLSKATEPEEIERALYSIVDNDFYKNELAQNIRLRIHARADEPTQHLSDREVEILLLICQELTPADISARLQISEKTFFNHRANILIKTGAKNNVGLLKFAISKGLWEPPKS